METNFASETCLFPVEPPGKRYYKVPVMLIKNGSTQHWLTAKTKWKSPGARLLKSHNQVKEQNQKKRKKETD